MTGEEIERLWIAAHAQLSDESPEDYFARILIGRARIAALEEAAKECDLMQAVFERQARGGDNTGASDFRADAAERCAVGIRALKDAP